MTFFPQTLHTWKNICLLETLKKSLKGRILKILDIFESLVKVSQSQREFWFHQIYQKTNKFVLRIFALASKMSQIEINTCTQLY